MPNTLDIRSYPRTDFDRLLITGASASSVLRCKCSDVAVPTVPTAAGTTAVTLVMPATGTLVGVYFVSKDALAAHDTNFVTFGVVNKSNSNAAMLAATAANTTKVTGGTALTAYTPRSLTLNGTAANLVVALGQCLEFQVTGSGTLANTLTENCVLILVDAVG